MTAAPSANTGLFPARRPLGLGFLWLGVLGAGLFGWGAFATISGAVIAAGQVEVETRDQVVEHIDGGTVVEILVRNGDTVKAGDVLIRLDDTLPRSEAAILQAEYAELAARRNRLEAEFRDTDAIAWSADLSRLAKTDAEVREILDGQQRLFEVRRTARAGQVAQLRERIGQTKKQIAGLEAQAAAAARQSGLIARELEAQRGLFKQGLTQLHQLLELEREAARLEGQAGDIEARIAGARGRIAEIEIAILQIGTRRIEEAEGEAREAQARENQVRERLAAVRGRLGRMEVRAPVAGEVFAMTVFALGEVVRPGEQILHIVPADTGLVVRAQLEPIHVDQVYPGQEAVLRFSAFSARTTPEFEGRIVRVSADAAHDDRTGLSWYEVEVGMGRAIEPEAETDLLSWLAALPGTMLDRLPEAAREWLNDILPAADEDSRAAGDARGAGPVVSPDPQIAIAAAAEPEAAPLPAAPGHARDLALAPGMPVEVHIRTGERSPLSYLAKPLTDYFSRSLREE